jgi:hypothetical protein
MFNLKHSPTCSKYWKPDKMKKLTDKEVIEKVISIAQGNGWSGNPELNVELGNSYYRVIFDHEFAKALFGEQYFVDKHELTDFTSSEYDYHFGKVHHEWQYHLQQLVLSEDRIDYLRKFIEGKK